MATEQNTGGADSQEAAATQESATVVQDTPNLGAIRKSGQQSVLDVLSKVAGVPITSTKDAGDLFAQLIAAQSKADTGGSEQPTKKEAPSKSNSELSELRQMIQTLQSQVTERDQLVKKTTLESQIKDVAIKTGFDPGMMDLALPLIANQVAFDEQGGFYVKGSDGGVKLDGKGNPYTLEALAQDTLRARPKLAVEDARTGTGTKFGFGPGVGKTGIPDASTDMAGWKAWKSAQGGGKDLKGMGVLVNKPNI